jgi:hypothetical protein
MRPFPIAACGRKYARSSTATQWSAWPNSRREYYVVVNVSPSTFPWFSGNSLGSGVWAIEIRERVEARRAKQIGESHWIVHREEIVRCAFPRAHGIPEDNRMHGVRYLVGARKQDYCEESASARSSSRRGLGRRGLWVWRRDESCDSRRCCPCPGCRRGCTGCAILPQFACRLRRPSPFWRP